MSFSIPYIFKNGVRKKREYAATQQCLQKHPPSSMSSSSSSSGMSNGEGKEPSSYPTLVSMIQSKTGNSPNPSPTSSTSSRSRPTSIAACPSVLPEPEELEENRFYRYIRSHFNLIFSRSLVVCIPHSKSLEGLVLTKDFIGKDWAMRSVYLFQQASLKVNVHRDTFLQPVTVLSRTISSSQRKGHINWATYHKHRLR